MQSGMYAPCSAHADHGRKFRVFCRSSVLRGVELLHLDANVNVIEVIVVHVEVAVEHLLHAVQAFEA